MPTPPPSPRPRRAPAALLGLAAVLVAGSPAHAIALPQQGPSVASAATDSLSGLAFGLQETIEAGDASALAAGPQGGPQAVAGISFDNVMQQLKANAMGILKGCDYSKYLAMAEQLGSAQKMVKELDGEKVERKVSFPMMDWVSSFVRSGSMLASREAAKAETKSLVLQIEQVCQTVVQADEINRQYQIMSAGRVNIGNALRYLNNQIDMRIASMPGTNALEIEANWTELYSAAVPRTGSPKDTLFNVVDDALKETFTEIQDIKEQLERNHTAIGELRKETVVLATLDQNAAWSCPEEFKDFDPAGPETQWIDQVPVCGPASPERQEQVAAALSTVSSQTATLEIELKRLQLKVSAIGLAVDNQGERVRTYQNQQSALQGF